VFALTSSGHRYAEFQRALKNGNLWVAEAAAREPPRVSLEDAFRLVHLYAERESAKFEPAARRWLRRFIDETEPTLRQIAEAAQRLAPEDQD
jgi:hypothetical protein